MMEFMQSHPYATIVIFWLLIQIPLGSFVGSFIKWGMDKD